MASTITRDSSAPEFRILAVGATGSLTLQQTTVSGGAAAGVFPNGIGGGILNHGILTLTTSTVSGNSANISGGIRNYGTLTVHRSTVSYNTAGFAGGGGIGNIGTLTLTFGVVRGNTHGGLENFFGTVTVTTGNVSGNTDFGIANLGTMTLTNCTVSGNTQGIENSNRGTLTVTSSTVRENSGGGGIFNSSGTTLTVTDSTVSGNTAASFGGGITNCGTVTLTNSTVEGNSGQSGAGINNSPRFCLGFESPRYPGALTVTNSTISGNTDVVRGGGVGNKGTATFTNSTVSGNSAAERGGGVDNNGTVTLTNSTVSRNASGSVAGGIFNSGSLTLVQSLLSGNTAPAIAPEAYSTLGTVIGDSFNVFGHDSFSGVAGFTLGATDIVPAVPLSAILGPTLGYNGGPTKTHTLVFGSPAVDTIPGVACATGFDQRGAPRPQDADGDTVADCDSGAVERGLVPIKPRLSVPRSTAGPAGVGSPSGATYWRRSAGIR